jgi:putative DNA primase/helicase
VVLQASAGEAKNAPSAAPQEEKSDGEEPPAGPVLPLPSNGNKSPYVPDPSAECKDGFPTTVVELLKRYVYVSVMDKVLDRKKGAFMSCSSLRNTISGRQFQTLNDGWVNLDFFKLPRRRMCTPDEIVFNPSKKVKFPKINLFTGFHHDRSDPIPREEVNEKVEATLLLLHYMCGQEAEYVLKWLAYPLIYPGAKMRSSLIIHGSQGIGKNLVFERAMIGAYGIWGRLIDQRDLDSAFNGWISKKLYIVADEVATDKRKIDTSNLLKSWITGGTVSVNEKNLPVREEENHCNFVFLSNNSIPIFVDEDDRRYCVVRVPDAPMDTEMYNQVASDLWETKGLHWYQYLKSLDVPPEFIREKVPHNLAKVELKQSCKNSTDLFLDEFGCIEEDGTQDLEAAREGRNDMRLPYGPCKTTDLYRGYRVWCKWNGISHPVSHRSFTMRGPAKRKWIKGRTASNRYVVPPEVGEPETHWKLDEVLEEFEKAVDTYNDRRGAA